MDEFVNDQQMTKTVLARVILEWKLNGNWWGPICFCPQRSLSGPDTCQVLVFLHAGLFNSQFP